MAKKGDENLVVGLDIGTSKVLAIVGEVTATGEVEVIGVGHHPSRGMKKGWWSTSNPRCNPSSVPWRPNMAGCQIKSVHRYCRLAHPLDQFARHGRDQGQGGRTE
jgi:cell division protein FtsA